MRRVALAIALAACGARTDLGGTHVDDAGTTGACTPPPPAPNSCTVWTAGERHTISTDGNLADATASGCGVLVAWSTFTPTSITWSTRWIDFDGAPLSPELAHPSLATPTLASGSMSLASDGATTGLLEADTAGCHFVTTDASGHEQGAVIGFGSSPGCIALARTGAEWTFLRMLEGGGGTLVTLDNGATSETPLAFSQSESLWDRLVFADGTFLVSAFWEDSVTVKYTNWLTPFDAKGAPIGASIPVSGLDSAPVQLVRAGKGAMAAWDGSTVEVMPVDELGHATQASQTVTTDSPIYELSVFATPSGDVLVTWIVLDEVSNYMSLHARAIAPDGTPRGPATLLADHVESTQARGAVESTGSRALLFFKSDTGAIEALPLSCQ